MSPQILRFWCHIYTVYPLTNFIIVILVLLSFDLHTSIIFTHHHYNISSLMAQMVQNPSAIWSLGREDPLEKEMATHSSILAWKIPWTEEPGGLQSLGLQRVGHDRVTSAFIFTFIILLQYSQVACILTFTSKFYTFICFYVTDQYFLFQLEELSLMFLVRSVQ